MAKSHRRNRVSERGCARADRLLRDAGANSIWKNNTAEVMKHPGTDPAVFEDVIEFARAIGMVALPLYKEQPGYILNSLLVSFLDAAQMLLLNGVADVETIDITLAKAGGNPDFEKLAYLLKTEYLDKGRHGRITEQGFYSCPNPSFASPDILRNQ